MPMHLNSLTPMRICGTPRSFLNLDSRCPTSIEVVAIGGGLDSPLPTLGGGLVSMNMFVLVIGCRPQLLSEAFKLGSVLGVSCSIHVAARSGVRCAIRRWARASSRIP